MGDVHNRGTKDRPNWYCRYFDIDGKRKHRPTHQTTKAAALRYVAEIEARVARGQIGIPEISIEEQRQAAVTVGELADRFLAEYNPPKLRNHSRYITEATHAFNGRLRSYSIAGMPAAEVRKLDVVKYRDALRTKGYRPSTINQTLCRVSLLFNWALEQEIIDCKNPFDRVERMPARPSEECYTRADVERLLMPEHRHPLVAVALYCGLRRGEIAGLTWECVRFDLGRLVVKRSFRGLPKNGKPRTIPLHTELVPILREWQARCPENREGLVFPVLVGKQCRMHTRSTMARMIRALAKRVGCREDFERPIHAMRRTFATLFNESGGSRDALEQILGHTTSGNKITALYVLPSIEHLAREMAKLTLQPSTPAQVLRLDAYR